MFTGIITALGQVRSIDPIAQGHDMRLVIDAPATLITARRSPSAHPFLFRLLPDRGGIRSRRAANLVCG